MSVVSPALSSTSRRKSHCRGRRIAKREKGVDFACNQVRLLLAGFGYQIMHVQRAVLERMTGTGWSLRQLAARQVGAELEVAAGTLVERQVRQLRHVDPVPRHPRQDVGLVADQVPPVAVADH